MCNEHLKEEQVGQGCARDPGSTEDALLASVTNSKRPDRRDALFLSSCQLQRCRSRVTELGFTGMDRPAMSRDSLSLQVQGSPRSASQSISTSCHSSLPLCSQEKQKGQEWKRLHSALFLFTFMGQEFRCNSFALKKMLTPENLEQPP